MSQARAERADAARNRRAILAATEELLATHRPQDISIEQVAAAAGVGKGTVFHRFGNRMGLMTALMIERAQALTEAVTSGPPPLGPGAPNRDRLLAFLDAVIDVVSRNKSLLAELAFSAMTGPVVNVANQDSAGGKQDGAGAKHDDHPVYRFWHGHISALITAQRPGTDAEMIAHVLLGALHSEPILAHLAAEGPQRPKAAVRALACAVLDAPRLPALRGHRRRAQARCQQQRNRDRGRHDRHRRGRGAPLGRQPQSLSKRCLIKVGARW
jgi:AcrR family transcriptional regulator